MPLRDRSGSGPAPMSNIAGYRNAVWRSRPDTLQGPAAWSIQIVPQEKEARTVTVTRVRLRTFVDRARRPSPEILHQHQIAAVLIDLRVQNRAAVRRNGKRRGVRIDDCFFRKLPDKRRLAYRETEQLQGDACGIS